MVKQGRDENRLYFITRSVLMSTVCGIIFLVSVWLLKTINFIQSLILGVFVFFVSLFISAIFDSYIKKLVKKILKFLDKHSKIKKIILKYF